MASARRDCKTPFFEVRRGIRGRTFGARHLVVELIALHAASRTWAAAYYGFVRRWNGWITGVIDRSAAIGTGC